MIAPIEADLIHYSITGASDWEMFKFTFAIIGAIFVFMWGIVTALIVALYYSTRNGFKEWGEKLEKRIVNQRQEDRDSCHDCKGDSTREMDAIWENIKACCAAAKIAPITKKDIAMG